MFSPKRLEQEIQSDTSELKQVLKKQLL